MRKRRWWSMRPKVHGVSASLFSGVDEMFHGTAKQAQEIREEQNRQAIDIGNSEKLNRLTLRMPKQGK